MKQLLFSITKKDFTITWFSGQGAGGQNRNKNQNCCRLIHTDSNILSTGQSHRNRVANQREAFKGLVNNPKFKIWLNTRIYNATHTQETIEHLVDKAMHPNNIQVEYGV